MACRCGWFLALFLPLSAFAQAPLIVEEVNGRKATVYVPVNVELKPGDTLVPGSGVPAAPAPTVPPVTVVHAPVSAPAPTVSETVCADVPASAKSELRPRIHNLALKYDSGSTDVEIETTPTSTETSTESGNISVVYGYETGFLQPMISVSGSSSKDKKSSDKDIITGTMLGLRVNFIKNVPGQNLIPYALIGFGRFSGELKTGTTDVTILGNMGGGELGLDWYPFGEIFAFQVAYYSSTADLRASGGVTEVSATMKRRGLSVGYVLSF